MRFTIAIVTSPVAGYEEVAEGAPNNKFDLHFCSAEDHKILRFWYGDTKPAEHSTLEEVPLPDMAAGGKNALKS